MSKIFLITGVPAVSVVTSSKRHCPPQISDLDDPPLRLLLGTDAYNYGTAAGRALADAALRRRPFSVSDRPPRRHAWPT